MIARIALLFFAAVFLCVGITFMGIGLYQALLLAMAPWAASLVTGVIGLVIAGLFAIVGSHWNSGPASALGGPGFNAAAASISRAVETNPLVAVAAAAAVGIVQSLFSGRRR